MRSLILVRLKNIVGETFLKNLFLLFLDFVGNKKNKLIEKNIFSLEDLPVDYPLGPKQQVYVNSVLHNEPAINVDEIQQKLENLQYPIHFLDFETDNPPIPRFDGLRPYQHFPFQYSCHVLYLDSNGLNTTNICILIHPIQETRC